MDTGFTIRRYRKLEFVPEFIACVCSDSAENEDDAPATPKADTKPAAPAATSGGDRKQAVARNADPSTSKAQDGVK